MSDVVFTGLGDADHDRLVVDRANRYQRMGEVLRRTDKTKYPLRKLHERVYTTNLRDPPEDIFRRNTWKVLGTLYPGMVVSARSAWAARPVMAPGPDNAAFVFLTGSYRRNVSLPGLEVRVAPGPGQLSGDVEFMGLYLASPARHCLENLVPSRDRAGVSRTTGRDEVKDFLVRTCRMQGEAGLNALREQAKSIKGAMGAEQQFDVLNGMIGAILKSRDASPLRTPSALAWANSAPYDPECAETLDALFSYLSSNPMPTRPDLGKGTSAATNTAFLEAYFSNYIEGTRFLVDEAKDIAFNGKIPDSRPKDGHDVMSTFRLLADHEGMTRTDEDFDKFVEVLRARHSFLMAGRPEVNPGTFKTANNQAGNTVFVEPALVGGTLKRGHEMLQGLVHPFARGAFVHFLVSSVHPFEDGNGRLSRIMMANELTAGGQARAVVPTVYRDDYLGGQRALSRKRDAGANFRALNRCQDVTSRIVEENIDRCIERWASTGAFVEPGPNADFRDPSAVALVARGGVLAPADYWEAEDGNDSAFKF